eukprot:33577_1
MQQRWTRFHWKRLHSQWKKFKLRQTFFTYSYRNSCACSNKIYPIMFALPLPAHEVMRSDRQGEEIEGNRDNVAIEPADQNELHNYPSPYSTVTFKQVVIGSILSIFTGAIGFYIYKKLNEEYILTEEDKKILELISSRQQMGEILVLGKAGIGKSYLIDALIGADLAEENDTNTGTFNVKSFDIDIKIQNVKLASLKIWDSVGFFSELTERQCVEQLYKAKNCGIIFLVINGNAPRLYDDLERLYPILNKLYNGDSWIHKSVIVVTRGNEMIKMKSKTKLNKRINEWNQTIPKCLQKCGMSKDNASNIPIIWAYGKTDKNWKRILLSNAIERALSDQKNALVMIDPYNVNDNIVDDLDDGYKMIIKRKPKIRLVPTYNKIAHQRMSGH